MLLLSATELSCIRDDRTLFEGLSFDLTAGQLLLVEGANGSGKTSLLRILCGIRLPDSGQLTWSNDQDDKKQKVSVDSSESYGGEMAFLGHQDGNKLDLTVAENIAYAQAMAGTHDAATDALSRVGLNHFEDVYVSNLSAGQRRRLALARLLVTNARLWIMDEPFTALDKSGVEMAEREISRQLDNGGMVIMTSHHHVNISADKMTGLHLGR